MTQSESIQQIQKQLEQADIGKALDLLQQHVKQYHPQQKNDATALRATYLNAKRQYEVQGIIDRREFELIFNKTLNGIQQLMSSSMGESVLVKAPVSTHSNTFPWKAIVAAVAVMLIIGAAGFNYFSKTTIADNSPIDSRPLDSTVVVEKVEKPVSLHEKPTESISSSKPEEITTKPSQKKKTKPKTTEPPLTKEAVNTPITEPTPSVIKKEAPKVVEYLEVKLVVNASHSQAAIFVDGQAAQVLKNTPIVKTIRVEKKSSMHQIELRNGDRPCSTQQLITTNGQKINLNC